MTTYTIALELTKEVQRVKRPVCVRINENETQTIKAQLTRYFKPCTVECDKAQLHMLRDDGTWSHVDATCDGSSVECAIKAVQLGKTAQNACAYFFFQKGTKTETTESFQLRVERAAIDTEASDAFFDTTMNAIATKWGAYENAAEAQESARKDAESKRITAEQERVSAEQARVTAEQKRVQAEQERASAESERKEAEKSRNDVYEAVLTKESERREAERSRVSAEQSRAQAEQARAQAETARQQNESTRTSAEQSRQSRFNEMLDAAQNVKFRILSSNEVDSEGKPTITGSVGIIYLVKAQSSEETKANHYTEWIYLENRWELFGSTAPTADPIEVDDIDKLAQGTTIAGNRVLNATGLSALWSKLQTHMHDLENSVFSTATTAKGAEMAARGVRSDITSLWLTQKKLDNDFSALESETKTLQARTKSVEQKLENGLENARKSRVVLRIRSKSEDTSKGLWCNCSFVNTNGFIDFNGYINTSLVPANIISKQVSPMGQIFFAFDDGTLDGPCSFFQPNTKDYVLSLYWQSSDNGFSVKGSLGSLFSTLYLTCPGDKNDYSKSNLGALYTHATYPQFTPRANNNFDKLPKFIDKINETLGKDGLIASYELY